MSYRLAITSARKGRRVLLVNPLYTTILKDRLVIKYDPAFLPKVASNFIGFRRLLFPRFRTAQYQTERKNPIIWL